MEPIADPEELAQQLAELFGSSEFRYTIDEITDTLFIQIKGLDAFSQDAINKKAGDFLEEFDSEFDEIVLLPL
jgi:hypothetical protein